MTPVSGGAGSNGGGELSDAKEQARVSKWEFEANEFQAERQTQLPTGQSKAFLEGTEVRAMACSWTVTGWARARQPAALCLRSAAKANTCPHSWSPVCFKAYAPAVQQAHLLALQASLCVCF